jgi:hypothetical protein
MKQYLTVLFLVVSAAFCAQAADYEFQPIPNPKGTGSGKGSYSCVPGTEDTIEDIPPARSQSMNNCFIYTATALADFDNCQELKRKGKKSSCSGSGGMSPVDRFSVLDTSRFGIITKDGYSKNMSELNKIFVEGGGSAAIALQNLIDAKHAASEKCAPFDVFVSKTGSVEEQRKLADTMWANLKAAHSTYQEKLKTCGPECAAYFAQTTANDRKNFPDLKTSNVEILKAFGAATYEEFLAKLLVPDSCQSPDMQVRIRRTGIRMQSWPQSGDDKSVSGVIEQIKKNLKKQRILGIESICMESTVTASCKKKHSLVVQGYCEMCLNGVRCAKPIKALKVQNSWGQSWQDKTDGWVEAEPIIKRTDFQDASNTATLFWIEENK